MSNQLVWVSSFTGGRYAIAYSPYLSIVAACAAEIAFPLSSGITPVFLLWTDGLAMFIVVFGVGGERLPAKHGACQHSGFLSFGDTNSSICDVGNFSIGFSIDFHFRKQISFFPSVIIISSPLEGRIPKQWGAEKNAEE